MLLMLMSSPPPSIPDTVAPPFSLSSDWLTDGVTAGRWTIPLPLLCLSLWSSLLPPPVSHSRSLVTHRSQPSDAAEAEAESLALSPRRILHVWKHCGQGCCRQKERQKHGLLRTFEAKEAGDPGAVLDGQRIHRLRSSSLICGGKIGLLGDVFFYGAPSLLMGVTPR